MPSRAIALEGGQGIANSAAMRSLAAFLMSLMTLCAQIAQAQAPVTVFAAASLRGVLEDIAATSDNALVLSYGGSGTMARQVAAGAPVDAVILASTLWMDWLVAQRRVTADNVRPVAHNGLVVVAPEGTPPLTSAQDLLSGIGTGRLAMGQRDAVPAGTYARQFLQAAGLWDALQSQLAETDNVRAALVLVARGQAPYGVVYATDAQAEPRVGVVWTVPDTAHDPIIYPAAALTPKGRAFLDLLTSATAQDVLRAHGFAAVQQ